MKPAPTGAWRTCAEGLCFGKRLTVSFQRYLSAEPLIDQAPPSLGPLPVHRLGARFLLPLYEAEAVWIGLSSGLSAHTLAQVSAIFGGRWEALAAIPSVGAGALRIEIIPGAPAAGGGFRPLSLANGLGAMRFDWDGSVAEVTPVAPAEYEARTGRPPPEPAEVTAAFGGHLLP